MVALAFLYSPAEEQVCGGRQLPRQKVGTRETERPQGGASYSASSARVLLLDGTLQYDYGAAVAARR